MTKNFKFEKLFYFITNFKFTDIFFKKFMNFKESC